MRLLDLGYMVPHGWREVTVADIATKVGSGATPRGGSSVYTDTGIPLVRSQNVLDNVFNHAGLAFITERSAQSLKNVELQADDVLLNITGDSILRCCLLPDTMIGGRVNQHVAIIRATDEVVPQYLQKWLVQDWFKDFMLSHSAGATRKAITKGQILSFPIAIPPIAEQRRIAGVLGTLDDKIESNRQVILLAKQLILALYRETLGAGELTSYPLDELFEVQIGRTPPRKESEWFTTIERDSKAWASIKDMSSAEPFIFHTSERLTEAAVSKHRIPIVQAGNILLSFKLTVGRVCIAPYPMCTNEAIASLTPRLPNVRNWAYAYLLGFNYEQLGNTSSIGKAVNSKIIAAMPVLCPDDETLSKFSNSTDPLLLLAENCQRETQALCNLRDALLPELMSGRMRVDEAGRLVSEALDEEVR